MQFKFQAIDANGRKTTGICEAASRQAALDQLARAQTFVVRLEEATGTGAGLQLPNFFPAASNADLVLFYRRLSTLIASDIPLLESLNAIEGQMSNPRFRAILADVKEDVRQGASFSHALSRHPRTFPELMVSMVRVGEAGGMLGPIVEQLAEFTERDNEIRGEVKAALAYPIVVLILAIGTVGFLLMTVVPKLTSMFEGMRVNLPAATRFLVSTSEFLTGWGLLMFPAFLIVAFIFHRYTRTPNGRVVWDRAKLRIPLVGDLVRKSTIARFARSLGALVHGGVPLMEGLDVVKRVLSNEVLTQAVDRVQERVRKGEGLTRGIQSEDLFPDMVRYMISAGEDSGKLDEMLLKIADIYDMETRRTVKVMINLMAPILIVIVAAVVGFIAFAMLMPIFQINQMIN